MKLAIRFSTQEDLPQIVTLLKQSLGEVSSIKSETYWRWKHELNPFGVSPVMLAEADGRLVGVRAMMQWKWQKNELNYSSLRAVDTATHPLYQGKGVFGNLTRQMIQYAEGEGYSFVFNTPNKKSLPGYLKMGWQPLMKVPVYIKPVTSLLYKSESNWRFYQDELLHFDTSLFSGVRFFKYLLQTPKTSDYIHWRYKQCPFKDYGLVAGSVYGLPFAVIVKRKITAGIYELRICDYWIADPDCFPLMLEAAVKAARKSGCLLISMCLNHSQQRYALLKSGFMSVSLAAPVVTVRSLSGEMSSGILLKPASWHLQNGDMELF